MKVKIDNDKLIIYINKCNLLDIDMHDKNDLELYFKSLFLKLNDNYGIKARGFYEINVYQDKYYGIILSLQKEEVDDYIYFNNGIDMCIKVNDQNSFLYEVDDYFFLDDKLLKCIDILHYNDKIYIKIKEQLDEVDNTKLIEHTKEIVYNNTYINNKFNKLIVNPMIKS